jgi:hypothetical protein
MNMVRNIIAFQSIRQRNALILQNYEKEVDIGDCLRLVGSVMTEKRQTFIARSRLIISATNLE